MSKEIINEIKEELDTGHYMVFKTYKGDDLEYHEIFRYQGRLLANLAKTPNDLTPVSELLKRDYLEIFVFDNEEDRLEFVREEAV